MKVRAVGQERQRFVRICAGALVILWLVGTAAAFASLPPSLAQPAGAAAIAALLASGSGVVVFTAVFRRPTMLRLLACAVALFAAFLVTLRDIWWLQGEGRSDGQGGLVSLDPVVLLLAFPAALLILTGLRGVWTRRRGR